MRPPKYPKDLSTILEVDSTSQGEERNKEGWIMSTSKSFCALVSALMAADGKFGPKNMNATLLDVLDKAQETNSANPDKLRKIAQYREMILAKGCGDVTMSQLLSHRSGLLQGPGYLSANHQFKDDNFALLSSSMLTFDETKKGKVFSYGNTTYVLAEELIGLVSDLPDGYYAELETRVFDPLGLFHTKSIYASEEATNSASPIILVKGVMGVDSTMPDEDAAVYPLTNTATGNIPLSAGGLCSSIGDLEIYSAALSKMICGIPTPLADAAKAKVIHQFYLDAYKAGEHCVSDSPSVESTYGAPHYSLGIFIGAVDEKGNKIPSRGNEERQCLIRHIGNFPGNDSSMEVVMPFSFSAFESGEAAQFQDVSPQSILSIKQSDVLAKHSLLLMVSNDYLDRMNEYFLSKCAEGENPLEDGWIRYWQHLSAIKHEPISSEWQDKLIAEGKLPKNFARFHDQILAAYEPAQQALQKYVIENFFGEDGIIDPKKVAANLKTAEDFEKVAKAIEEELSRAHAQVAKIFARADKELNIEKGGFVALVAEGRKAKEFEDLPAKSELWQDVVLEERRAKDDSEIVRKR
jgi:hypothetical protein